MARRPTDDFTKARGEETPPIPRGDANDGVFKANVIGGQSALLHQKIAGIATAAGAREAHEEADAEAQKLHDDMVQAYQQRQLRRAIRKLTKSLESDRLEIRNLLQQETELRGKIRENNIHIERIQQIEIPRKQQEITAREEKIEEIKQEIAEKKEERNEWRDKAIELKKDIKDALDETSSVMKEIGDAHTAMAKAADAREQHHAGLVQKIEKKMMESNTSHIMPMTTPQRLQNHVMSSEYMYNNQPLSKLVPFVLSQEELDEFLKKDAELNNSVRNAQDKFQTAAGRLDELKDKNKYFEAKESEVNVFIDKLTKDIEGLEKQLKAEQGKLDADQAELKRLQTDLAQRKEWKANWESDLEKIQDRREFLEKVVASKEAILERAKELERGDITPSEYIYGKKDPNGKFEVDGEKYSTPPIKDEEMRLKIRESFEKNGIKIEDPNASYLSQAWTYITGSGAPNEQIKRAAAAHAQAQTAAAEEATKILTQEAEKGKMVDAAAEAKTAKAADGKKTFETDAKPTAAFQTAAAPLTPAAEEAAPAPDTPAIPKKQASAVTGFGAPT